MIQWTQLEQAVGLKVGPEGKVLGITLGDILGSFVPFLLTLAGLLLFLYLIFGGFSLMLSRGDPKAMEAAKGKITNAAIGFAIVFTAYWLVQLLSAILGLKGFGGIF